MISAAAPNQDERLSPPAADRMLLSDLASASKAVVPAGSANPNKKKVLFVTSELADLVKTGGLGEYDCRASRGRYWRHTESRHVHTVPGKSVHK